MKLERSSLLVEAETITRKSPFSREDSAKVDALLRLADSLGAETIHRADDGPYGEAFRAYLRTGDNKMIREAAVATFGQRALLTTNTGANLVARGFTVALESALKAYDPLFNVSTLVETANGSPFNHPFVDDAVASQVATEGVGTTSTDPAFSAIAFSDCPRESTGYVLVASELINDALYDLPTVLAQIFAGRIARGAGSRMVTSLLADATSALTTTGAGVITADELLTLPASLDAAYAARGTWMMGFSTYLYILKIKGSTSGDFMFPAEADAAGYPLLCSRRVYLSPNMPAIASGSKPVTFGDHGKFFRRVVRDSQRLNVKVERWAESGQVGYELQLRIDGKLAKNTNAMPVKYITMHA